MFYGISKLGAVASFVTAVVLGSGACRSVAQAVSSRPGRQEPVEAAVESAYKAYLRAWKEKDYASLNRLLSDDYRAVDFKGIVSTKANEIATAKEDRDYETLNGDVISVNVFADSAIASGLIEASWKDEQGKMRQITLRFLAMLQKQKGEWKLVATQSTRFSRPNSQ
jgi:ketosteroid isomerase-like protein